MLIVMTGIDGSGKTTQAELLVDYLRSNNTEVYYVWTRWKQIFVKPLTAMWKKNITRETGFEDGRAKQNKQKKQSFLSNPILRWLWLSAFFIDYGLQILVKVRIRSIGGGVIISDRIFYDSVIDQAINLGVNSAWLLDHLNSVWMRVIFPRPDIVIFIDCPGDVAYARKDDAPDLEYLIDRRNLYKQLAEQYNWITIDGTRPVEDIAIEINVIVSQALNKSQCQK